MSFNIILSIASIQGLNPKEHLGKTLAEMRPILFKLVRNFS